MVGAAGVASLCIAAFVGEDTLVVLVLIGTTVGVPCAPGCSPGGNGSALFGVGVAELVRGVRYWLLVVTGFNVEVP